MFWNEPLALSGASRQASVDEALRLRGSNGVRPSAQREDSQI